MMANSIALVASAEENQYLLIKTTVTEEPDMPVAIQLYGELAGNHRHRPRLWNQDTCIRHNHAMGENSSP